MSGYSLLAGVRILEVAQLAPSSVGGQLADLGADVIKVESGAGEGVRHNGARAVGTPDGPGFMHLRWNRGKRSVALDLRSQEGRRTFLRLAATADAVIEGTRHGHLERLGLGWDALCEVRPQTVLCEVSGTGAEGPYRDLATGGMWFDAYAGMRTVDTDHPSPPGVMGGSAEVPQAMYAIGAYGAMAILAAVLRARETGVGARLQISSVDVATAWMPDRIDAALNVDHTYARPGWTPDGRLPDWPLLDAYATKDGGAIVLGSHYPKFWRAFCEAVGRPDLLEIDLSTVDEGSEERALQVWRALDALFRTRTKQDWVDLFLAHDVAGGPVNTVEELLEDPHFTARATTYEKDGPHGRLRFAASPVRVVGEEFAPDLAPDLGQHTDEVLGELS
ncbi:CaiB/BaiF CoA transferase family protein [Pseudonocardia halophobica]|uniref:CaiB/BaiF CoA transferase family protein n=1 Tax=Pseudonocardia halophobica TaxID=29401 RepID=UPI003D94D493